jgi:hypothetical protein
VIESLIVCNLQSVKLFDRIVNDPPTPCSISPSMILQYSQNVRAENNPSSSMAQALLLEWLGRSKTGLPVKHKKLEDIL